MLQKAAVIVVFAIFLASAEVQSSEANKLNLVNVVWTQSILTKPILPKNETSQLKELTDEVIFKAHWEAYKLGLNLRKRYVEDENFGIPKEFMVTNPKVAVYAQDEYNSLLTGNIVSDVMFPNDDTLPIPVISNVVLIDHRNECGRYNDLVNVFLQKKMNETETNHLTFFEAVEKIYDQNFDLTNINIITDLATYSKKLNVLDPYWLNNTVGGDTIYNTALKISRIYNRWLYGLDTKLIDKYLYPKPAFAHILCGPLLKEIKDSLIIRQAEIEAKNVTCASVPCFKLYGYSATNIMVGCLFVVLGMNHPGIENDDLPPPGSYISFELIQHPDLTTHLSFVYQEAEKEAVDFTNQTTCQPECTVELFSQIVKEYLPYPDIKTECEFHQETVIKEKED